jgi:hypothetical protein
MRKQVALLALSASLLGCASMTPEDQKHAIIAGVVAGAALVLLSQSDDEATPSKCYATVTTGPTGAQNANTNC